MNTKAQYKKQWRESNRDKIKIYSKRYRERDKAISLDRALGYKYGITPDMYRELIIKQNGKCAVCGNGETVLSRYGIPLRLAVDHCHTTGRIRGLLCNRCNRLIGIVNDDPALLRRMAAYIEVADTGFVVMQGSYARPLSIVDKLDIENLSVKQRNLLIAKLSES